MARDMRLHRLEYLHARRRFVAQEVRKYNMLKEAGLLTWRIEGDTLSDLVETLRAGPGWYEFIKRPEATTHIAYVHENGDVWMPDTGWTTAGKFALLTEGNEERLIALADVLALFPKEASNLRDFEKWWKSYWKNSTYTVEHTISHSIAYDAWWTALRNNP